LTQATNRLSSAAIDHLVLDELVDRKLTGLVRPQKYTQKAETDLCGCFAASFFLSRRELTDPQV
jgi:hypothetical protein